MCIVDYQMVCGQALSGCACTFCQRSGSLVSVLLVDVLRGGCGNEHPHGGGVVGHDVPIDHVEGAVGVDVASRSVLVGGRGLG